MTSTQKTVRLFIRLMLPVFALGGFGAIWGLVLTGLRPPPLISADWSPDRHYRASILRLPGFRGCADGGGTVVQVERSFHHVYTGSTVPLCLDHSPERLKVHWQDPATLEIDCTACDGLAWHADTNWGSLRFVYDLQRR